MNSATATESPADELGFLGCCIEAPQASFDIAASKGIRCETFASRRNGEAFRLLNDMQMLGIAINAVSAGRAFTEHGAVYKLTGADVFAMIDAAPSTCNAPAFADELIKCYEARTERERRLAAASIGQDRNLDDSAALAQMRQAIAGTVVSHAEEAVYDSTARSYWIRNGKNVWGSVDEAGLKRMLRYCGFSTVRAPGKNLSSLDEKVLRIQTERGVVYAGALAGFRTGVHEVEGNRVLVTTEAKLIAPIPGEHLLIDGLLAQCFVTDGIDQRPYVLGWLKFGVEALRAGKSIPGQVMILAGPAGSGKSLWQKIITEILGGRVGKPYRYLIGGTQFNADLVGCEHLALEDESPSSDLRSRRNLGARFKELTVTDVVSCHGKNKQAISLTPLWRVSMSLNDEAENLLILPPLDESLTDKLIMLKISQHPMPQNTGTPETRSAFWVAIRNELPAFIHTLLSEVFPDELRSERYGIKAFHHPALVDAMDELAPETKLLRYIDETLFKDGLAMPWKGTAEELQRELCNGPYGSEARRLLDWSNAAGTYLGRLAIKHPRRVEKDRKATNRGWVIKPS